MKRPTVTVCIAFMLLIWMANTLNIPLLKHEREAEAFKKEIELPCHTTITGKCDSCTSYEDYSALILSDTSLIKSDQNNIKREYKLNNIKITFNGNETFEPGDVLCVSGKLKDMPKATNEGQFDRSYYLKTDNIGFTMSNPDIKKISGGKKGIKYFLYKLRDNIRKRIQRIFEPEAAGILCAMLIGDKTSLSEETYSLYRIGGVAHMLVVSSMHLSILGIGIYGLIRKFGVSIKISCGISVATMFGYILISGMSASALRAFIMYLLFIGAKITGRIYDSYTALSLAAIFILIGNPYYLFTSAFQLSFTAVLFCMIASGKGKFTGALIIYFGTIPLVLYYFFELPVYGLLMNFVLVPLVPLMIIAGGIGTLLGGITALPAEAMITLSNGVLKIVQKLPFSVWTAGKPEKWQIIIYYFLYSLALIMLRKMRFSRQKCLMLGFVPILILCIGLKDRFGLKLSFLDVGQGDGIVLESRGFCMLIDGGSSSEYNVGKYRILSYLKSRGISKVNYVMLTHMDEDHINGIVEIMEMIRKAESGIEIEKLLLPKKTHEDEKYEKIKELAENAGIKVLGVGDGDRIINGRLAVDIISMKKDDEIELTENEGSLVACIRYGMFDALLTADIECKGEEHLIQSLNKYRDRDFEVLKVSHHGSQGATGEDFLNVLPNRDGNLKAVISYGIGNVYGHPSEETIRRLDMYGVKIFKTGIRGQVTIRTDGKTYKCSSACSEG